MRFQLFFYSCGPLPVIDVVLKVEENWSSLQAKLGTNVGDWIGKEKWGWGVNQNVFGDLNEYWSCGICHRKIKTRFGCIYQATFCGKFSSNFLPQYHHLLL